MRSPTTPTALRAALVAGACALAGAPAAGAQTLDFDNPAPDPNVRQGGDGWEYGEDWERHRRGGHGDGDRGGPPAPPGHERGDDDEDEGSGEPARRPRPRPEPRSKPRKRARRPAARTRRARDPNVPYGRLIARTARRHRLSVPLFTALVWAESNFNPRARSSAGASGLTQLMPSTARSLGVRRVFDPRQNLDGGARYLKAQLNRFRSVKLALAAYNAGPGAVRRHGGVPPYAETRNYVRKITARAAQLRRQGVR